MRQVNGVTNVQVQQRESGRVVREETNNIMGETKMINGEAAVAHVGLKMTENLGNYRSLSVEVAVTLPGAADEIANTIAEAKELASEFLGEYLTEAIAAATGKSTASPKPMPKTAPAAQPVEASPARTLDW